jgi:hypothetical protein
MKRATRFLLPLLLLAAVFVACNKDLNVNADWKDITVVYGLLDQTKDTTYLKITKAFLGPGDAMQFAKIPDSSNYPNKLEVAIEEYNGTNLVSTILCDTLMIHNKKPYDDSISFFYYPDQLMYYTTNGLNDDYTYKLVIRNKQTGHEITSQTGLISDFVVQRPQISVNYTTGQSFQVKWSPAQNGKRYQLTIRFWYLEALKSDPQVTQMKFVDWIVFNNITAVDLQSTQPFDYYFPGDGFYTVVGAAIPVNPDVTRTARYCQYIFSVAAPELNTYMEVTEPSLSIVQEKPSYTNIINGVGLFSARFQKLVDSLTISQPTKDELKVNPLTKDLGF